MTPPTTIYTLEIALTVNERDLLTLFEVRTKLTLNQIAELLLTETAYLKQSHAPWEVGLSPTLEYLTGNSSKPPPPRSGESPCKNKSARRTYTSS